MTKFIVFVVVAFADTCNPVLVCFPDDDLLLLLSASSRRANNSGDNSGNYRVTFNQRPKSLA